jgi:pyruvate/2-oxoglutarate dehydrogenase complex dihydrolipoamide dehydrogenase (E3) component
MKNVMTEAKSAGPGFVVATDGLLDHFDFIVSATGSWFEPSTFKGCRKPGVFVLDSPRMYTELGLQCGAKDRVVVAGEGWRALQVADRLSGHDRDVRVFISEWQRKVPSPLAFDVIEAAARRRGVSISRGTLERAVGAGPIEAAVSGDEVVPCDALAYVPRRIPRVIPGSATLGRGGGLLVDREMRTTAPWTYAAGGCAELDAGTNPPMILEGEAALSGRIAGANCMGGRHSIGFGRYCEALVFGLRWSCVGTWSSAACSSGLRVEEASQRWGESAACVISFEKSTKRVLGIESVEAAASRTSGVLSIGSGVSLQSLAYGGLGSSDISLVSDTARLGL